MGLEMSPSKLGVRVYLLSTPKTELQNYVELCSFASADKSCIACSSSSNLDASDEFRLRREQRTRHYKIAVVVNKHRPLFGGVGMQ